MTLTNHLLTGSVIAKFLPLPIAVPLAFVSHFILDSLPHFGVKQFEDRQRHKKLFFSVLALDIALSIALAVWLIRSGHIRWLIVGLIAFSPDTVWIYRFIVQEKFGKLPPKKGGRFVEFHSGIQKLERIWGGGVEVVYATGLFLLLR